MSQTQNLMQKFIIVHILHQVQK